MLSNDVVVSVIVPVYNVEKYISRCVESILQQEHSNIEVILVNDGSKDNSGKIIDGYKAKDKRVTVIHQSNMGVSAARNAGLKKANGKYVMFVDGDDYVEQDYVSYFLSIVLDNNLLMAVGKEFYSVDSSEQTEDDVKIYPAEKIIEDIYIGTVNVAVWNKIYDRTFLVNNNIFFDKNIWYGEGMLFNIKCLQYADNVAVGKRKVYHQVYNPNSAMRKFNLESQYCGLKSLELQKKLWIKKNKAIENAYDFHYRNFSISIILGLVGTKTINEYREVYRQCKKNLRRDLLLPWKINIPLKRKIIISMYSVIPNLTARITVKRNKGRAKEQEYLLLKNKGSMT